MCRLDKRICNVAGGYKPPLHSANAVQHSTDMTLLTEQQNRWRITYRNEYGT